MQMNKISRSTLLAGLAMTNGDDSATPVPSNPRLPIMAASS